MKKTEENELVDLLKRLNPGFLPYPIFEQIARLTALSIIEFVPLRINKSQNIEVLLLDREGDDPIWPNKVHTPGTVIRPGDNEGNQYVAFERIVKDELKDTKISEPHFVGSLLHKSKRGTEHAQIYWVEVLGEPKNGSFFEANKLPETLISSQRKFINQAVKSFRDNRRL
ncbi:MAG: hypothetical protein U5L95_04425 [Candidatus Saccharibacteria bacterium]|nr:hypothetical protein [Candidatus Saccharibacteria bacterium]